MEGRCFAEELRVSFGTASKGFLNPREESVDLSPPPPIFCNRPKTNRQNGEKFFRIEQILNSVCRIALWRLRCIFHKLNNLGIWIIHVRFKREVPVASFLFKHQFGIPVWHWNEKRHTFPVFHEQFRFTFVHKVHTIFLRPNKNTSKFKTPSPHIRTPLNVWIFPAPWRDVKSQKISMIFFRLSSVFFFSRNFFSVTVMAFKDRLVWKSKSREENNLSQNTQKVLSGWADKRADEVM